jgi:hypothetical protein
MNTEQRELFRLALLRVLDANHTRFGLSLSALGHLVATFGFPNPQLRQLERELQYLEDKSHVASMVKSVSPENAAWRITAEGRDYIANYTDDFEPS